MARHINGADSVVSLVAFGLLCLLLRGNVLINGTLNQYKDAMKEDPAAKASYIRSLDEMQTTKDDNDNTKSQFLLDNAVVELSEEEEKEGDAAAAAAAIKSTPKKGLNLTSIKDIDFLSSKLRDHLFGTAELSEILLDEALLFALEEDLYDDAFQEESNVTKDQLANILQSPSLEESIDPSKPTIVLHIGPYKMGTTFLQCSLSRNGYDLLLQDNYQYLGTCECRERSKKYAICLFHSKRRRSRHRRRLGVFQGHELMPEVLAILPELHAKKQNAMIVWEYFSDLSHKRFRHFIEQLKDWNVHIVVGYRRYYDWLPSFQAQMNTPYLWRYWLNTWIDQPHPQRPKVKGIPILPFDVYNATQREALKGNINGRVKGYMNMAEEHNRHPTTDAILRWKQYYPNSTISILNMHHVQHQHKNTTGDGLLTELFCNIIPNTPHTCQAARENKIETSLDNARYPINYDLLAVEAYHQGLFSNNTTTTTITTTTDIRGKTIYSNSTTTTSTLVTRIPRPLVRIAAQRRQENDLHKTSNDFPLTCLPPTSLNRLLNLSLSIEQDLFPNDVQQHKADFQKQVDKQQYCTIDAAAALKTDGWEDYFRKLQPFKP